MSMKKNGFTLIEIIVVIFVIGLVSSLAMFAIGGFGQKHQLENSMKQLVTRLKMAHMEAVFEQEHLGVAIDDRGYRFYRRLNERHPWQVISDESTFESDVFPKHQTLQVLIEGQSIQLSQNTPQIVLTQHDSKPFEIQVMGQDQKTFMIKSDHNGDIVWAVN